MTRHLPLEAARWLAVSLLVVAPWPYGCIPRWTAPWFTGILLTIGLLWVIGLVGLHRRPSVPAILFVGVVLLLFQGWLEIANAQYRYDRVHFQFVPGSPWIASRWFPGALDTADAVPAMWRITGLLAVLCVFTDMATKPRWRRRILAAIFVSGTALAVFGLAQRALNSSLLFWDQSPLEHNYFAGFYYHGNAGAFVNLLVPLAMGYAALAFSNPDAHAKRAIFLMALMVLLAAEVAIASKAAMVITGLLLVATGVVFLRHLTAKRMIRSRAAWIQCAIVVIVVLGTVSLFGFDNAVHRWSEFSHSASPDSPRLSAWRACLRMIPDAGLWGIGPGNFLITFPHYTRGQPGIAGIWEHAHEDYLETCIEWGWWGLAVWGVLFAGALGRAAKLAFSSSNAPSSTRLLTVFVGFSLAGVMLHALVDFPLQIPAIALPVAAFLGILWSDATTRDDKSSERAARISSK